MKKEYTIGWEQKCKGCGHHDSIWKTLVSSPQWKAWYAYQTGENQQYDVDECQELGIMSARHFQDFLLHQIVKILDEFEKNGWDLHELRAKITDKI